MVLVFSTLITGTLLEKKAGHLNIQFASEKSTFLPISLTIKEIWFLPSTHPKSI